MQATHVFIHGGQMHLLDMHIKGILLGNPIPPQYRVHDCRSDKDKNSVNLIMTNGGGPIDTVALAKHLKDQKIFGQDIEVGIFGEPVNLADAIEPAEATHVL